MNFSLTIFLTIFFLLLICNHIFHCYMLITSSNAVILVFSESQKTALNEECLYFSFLPYKTINCRKVQISTTFCWIFRTIQKLDYVWVTFITFKCNFKKALVSLSKTACLIEMHHECFFSDLICQMNYNCCLHCLLD